MIVACMLPPYIYKFSCEEYNDEEMYDARSVARAQSAHILAKTVGEREEMKQRMEQKRREQNRKKKEKKDRDYQKIKSKMKQSAFKVDLLAENERIDEVSVS